MNIETTREDALHRDFSVSLNAEDYGKKLDARLLSLAPQIRVPGFRPGKVPLKVLRKRFAERIHGEVVELTVDETAKELMAEHKLVPAMQPKIDIQDFSPEKGLSFTINVVLAGDFDLIDVKSLSPTRYVIAPEDAQIQEALERIQKDMRTSQPLKKKRKSKKGDLVVIDFVGSVDGKEFDGGKAEGHRLELGSNQMIPGFEDQIIGMSKGDTGDIEVTFPEEYHAKELAGKKATFAIIVQDVQAFETMPIDDEMAKKLGMDSLDVLKEQISARVSQEMSQLSEEQLKRELFDLLDSQHTLEVADEMIDAEYGQLEADYKNARANNQLLPEDLEQPEEEALEDLKVIALRRVRLALILAKFGEKFKIEVTEDDLRNQLIQETRNLPGQEEAFIQHIQKNEQAMQQLRSRAQEGAIVRVMLELINPEEKTVSREEFTKITNAMDAKPKKSAKKSTAKKPAAKKAKADDAAEKATEKKPAAKKPAAKKTPAKKADKKD